MTTLEILFWVCAGQVIYTYVLYPLLIAVAARFRRRGPETKALFSGSVSLVLSVHNEERRIESRLDELAVLLDKSGLIWEILVVSDGSTDATAALAQRFESRGVRVLELSEKCGKAAALSAGSAQAVNDILVFADVRQPWATDALEKLLRNFSDPAIGAVSGELLLERSPGILAGVGLYWRYEKWLRRQESRWQSTVGVTGAICAVRRDLFRPIPPGTLLDDVYWPLQVAMQGRRVVFEPESRAFDRLPVRTVDEFRRKVRTLSGNFQLLTRLPAALLPWRNPLWFQLMSHKVFRLLVPWTLLAMLVACALLDSGLYQVLFLIQAAGYGVGLLGLWPPVGARSRLAAAGGSFLVLNAAAWVAFWVWISGRAGASWHKSLYQAPAVGSPFSPGQDSHGTIVATQNPGA